MVVAPSASSITKLTVGLEKSTAAALIPHSARVGGEGLCTPREG